jgi:hypothetical protein
MRPRQGRPGRAVPKRSAPLLIDLVALLPGLDLLIFAKYLFTPARTVVRRAAGIPGGYLSAQWGWGTEARVKAESGRRESRHYCRDTAIRDLPSRRAVSAIGSPLSRIASRAGLVTFRQTFVGRCQWFARGR